MSVKEKYYNDELLYFVGSAVESLSPGSQGVYRRALASLDVFLSSHALRLADISETMVTDWAAETILGGLSVKSVLQYIDVLGSASNTLAKAGLLPATDAVRTAKKRIAAATFDAGSAERFMQKMLQVLRRPERGFDTDAYPDDPVWRDLLLFSVLNGAMPLAEAARLKKDDYAGDDSECLAVIARRSAPRRKYVFDLGQHALTSRQLSKKVADGVLSLLGRHVAGGIASAEDALCSFWTAMAIRCGALPSTALVCMPKHENLCIPCFALRASAPQSDKTRFARDVASAAVSNPLRWYAMRLRRRVDYAALKASIEADAAQWAPHKTFYPCEEISSREGRRMVTQQQPFIRDIVFFQSRVTDLHPLFRCIGDKAWCYRTDNKPGSPYAPIPDADMRTFQTAIGLFSEDTRIFPLGTLVPEKDEEVVVLAGLMKDRTGRFDRTVTDRKSRRTLYRVILQGDEGYEWRLDFDPRLISGRGRPPAPQNKPNS